MLRGFHVVLPLCLLSSVMLLTQSCGGSSQHSHDHHSHDHEERSEERGPHGGRLLTEGDVDFEIFIHEAGGPPRFRVFARKGGKPVAPSGFSVNVTLTRLDGAQEQITFTPTGDFQQSKEEISEPHSFDVGVSATIGDKKLVRSYPSYENRVTISDDVAKASGIETQRAQSQTIQRSIRMRGKITPSEHRIAHIIPRFAGVVKEGRKHIGDPVSKGEVLAIIESNQSLQPFEVKSQIAGSIINGHLIVGEFVPENQWVYIVADLSEVWADFFVPLEELGAVKVGQSVVVRGTASDETFQGTVDYVAPYADEKAQAQLVRVALPNDKMRLVPGMFVTGDLVVSEDRASVAVRKEAIQTLGHWTVAFVKYGDVYEARPLELGVRDSEWVEVRSGLAAGAEYVVKNSFTIKADILKHGASHDH